jgi:hypothetical protein
MHDLPPRREGSQPAWRPPSIGLFAVKRRQCRLHGQGHRHRQNDSGHAEDGAAGEEADARRDQDRHCRGTQRPKLAAYLEQHGSAIKARHVSKRNPQGWYRTIDRIYPELVSVPKLLIPDIKGEAHIVYEPGKLYPHHNLYFVTANEWDLRALQAVLLSNVTRMFITLYSTKMRGGYLRFQAQYLRRLRLPHWRDVPAALRAELVKAGGSRDATTCNAAAAALYKLTFVERQALAATSGVADAA